MEKYLFIGLTLAFTVYAQLALKARVLALAPQFEGNKARYVVAMFMDPVVLSGLVAAVVASACWMLALEKTDISLAYPFMALSFVLVPLAAAFIFGEQISLFQTAGLAMIVAGVGLNALSK